MPSHLATALSIEELRHPVVEDLMMKHNRGKTFIPNGIDMNSVTTGPNMGGKTTYLRSVALCVVLAQMGCYVPARRATIGVIDKVFSRVGSADDIVNDRSTFFNEVSETVTILRNGGSGHGE